jgi:hypothetical protein
MLSKVVEGRLLVVKGEVVLTSEAKKRAAGVHKIFVTTKFALA